MSTHLEFGHLPGFFRRYPAFFRVFLADALSQLGQGMLVVAFPMFVLEVTGDVSLTGLAFSGEIAAYGILSPVAGAWADRVEQKYLMYTANLGRAALLLILLGVLAHGGGLPVCMLLSVLLGATSALFVPARAAFLRRLLAGDDLLAAVALEGTSSFLIRMLAPALMGVLLVRFPATAGIYLNMAIYLASTALIAPRWVTGPRVEARADSHALGWAAGWRHIAATPSLRGLLTLDLTLSLVGMAAFSTTVAFLEMVLHLPAANNGFLLAGTGLAGAIGTRLASRAGFRAASYPLLLGLVSFTYLAVPRVSSLAPLVAIWMVRGIAIGMFVVIFSQQLAKDTPADRMGRVQAAWETSACLAAFLGSAATPWLLHHLGPIGAFELYGSITLVAGLVWLGLARR